MRTAKTLCLILALALGGLAFQLPSVETAGAVDALENTVWVRTEDGKPFATYSFEKGGKYSYSNDYHEVSSHGDYRLEGNSVEMIQKFTRIQHVGIIRGNEMTVTLYFNGKPDGESYVYSKKK